MSPTASRASALRMSFLLLWRDLLARELNLLLVALLVAVAAVTPSDSLLIGWIVH